MKNTKILKRTLVILILSLVMLLGACDGSFGLSVTSKKTEMYVGEQLQLQANVDDFDDKIIWASTDEEIATVDEDGLVKALKAGTTYITATVKSGDDEEISKVYLIVKEKDGGSTEEKVVKTISITGNQTIALDSPLKSTITLKATITNQEKNDKVVWESSDTTIATVTQDGLVTGVKIGVATIKASLQSDSTVCATLPIIVRSADGTQNIITNYIETTTYVVDGEIDLTSLNNKVVNTVSKYADSIIGVSNYQYQTTYSGFGFGQTQKQTLTLASVGSGVICKSETVEGGYKYTALTNYHVVESAAQLKVYLGDLDKEVEATLVDKKEDDDLAIVSFVTDRVYELIEFAEVDDYEVGDFVLAVGCPTGYSYYGSVTFGVVSYKNRMMDGETATFIQHDAAINPGNSGGALLNLDGKLLGLNTLKIATTEVEGMGFAVSMKTIMAFLNSKQN